MNISRYWQGLLFIVVGLAWSPPAEAAVLKQVLANFATMNTATVNVTLASSVDPTKAFVVCNNRTGITDGSNPTERVTCELGTGTYPVANPTNQLTITASAVDSGATKETVWYYVAEFSSGVTVQRGRVDYALGASGSNITINEFVLANTFVITTERMNSATQTIDEQWTWRGQVDLTCTHPCVAFDRNQTGTAASVAWQVISFDSAAVQQGPALPSSGNSNISGGNLSSTTSPAFSPAVNINKTFVVFGRKGLTAGTGIEAQYQVRCALCAGATCSGTSAAITCTRAGPASQAETVTSYAVPLSDCATTVQSGNTTIAAASLSADVAINAIVVANSVPFISVSGGGGGTGDLDDTSVSACFGTGSDCGGASTTNLHLQRTTSTTAATVSWFVVQFATSGGTLVDRVESYP